LAKTLKRGSNNCEAFGPHEFGEEGRDASEAIAINTIRGTSSSVLVMRGKREEGLAKPLNVMEKTHGDAMVHHLVHSPSFACIAY